MGERNKKQTTHQATRYIERLINYSMDDEYDMDWFTHLREETTDRLIEFITECDAASHPLFLTLCEAGDKEQTAVELAAWIEDSLYLASGKIKVRYFSSSFDKWDVPESESSFDNLYFLYSSSWAKIASMSVMVENQEYLAYNPTLKTYFKLMRNGDALLKSNLHSEVSMSLRSFVQSEYEIFKAPSIASLTEF